MVAIGFIGLGNMGGPMAEHLVNDGHDVVVFDLDPEACERLADIGAAVGDDVGQVAAQSEVVFLSLPTPQTVRHVTDELAEDVTEGTVLVDATTSTAKTTLDVAEQLDPLGVAVLGAPVSGGPSGAQTGTLTTMVGGDPATFEAVKPLFEAYATNIYHIGDSPGDGHVVKLLNNYLTFLCLLGTSEAVALGERAGLDADTIVEVINNSGGRNAISEEKFPDHINRGKRDLKFTLALMCKDLRLFSQFADENDAPVLLGDTVRNMAGYAKAEEGPDADVTRIYDFVSRKIDPVEDDSSS